MCRGNRCDIAFQMARRLSDQDIMPRYRMTPPVRDRCPSLDNAERATCDSFKLSDDLAAADRGEKVARIELRNAR
jgi:hypothetical protein